MKTSTSNNGIIIALQKLDKAKEPISNGDIAKHRPQTSYALYSILMSVKMALKKEVYQKLYVHKYMPSSLVRGRSWDF